MKATQRLYRSLDGDVVAESDPRAHYLLAPEGDDIPKEYQDKAKAFQGEQPEEQPEPEVEEQPAEEPDEKKAPAAPNKQRRRATNK